jgi:ribosomal protein L9
MILAFSFCRFGRLRNPSCSSSSSSSSMGIVSPFLHLRWKHTVRVILTETIDSHRSKGDVLNVSAGFARNYLIPKKKALYAIPENFQRLGLKDTSIETLEERQLRLTKEAADAGNVDLIAANVLNKYLQNKTVSNPIQKNMSYQIADIIFILCNGIKLRMRRNIDPRTRAIYPNMVDAKALRDKLSKQLKIDLDDTEQIHIRPEPIVLDALSDEEIVTMLNEIDTSSPCKIQLRQLGSYVAKISLQGGYSVALKFMIDKR